MSDRFEPTDADAAAQLDRAVDELLAGREAPGVDSTTAGVLARLLAAHRAGPPPPALTTRIAATVRRYERRRWLPAQVAAAILGALLLGQGLGNLVAGSWVARHLDVPFDSHAFFEGGVVLLALGGVVLAGGLARRWLDLSALAGAPVGIAFAINGAQELAAFPAGGILHLSQGAAALALAILWWRIRSLRLRRTREHRA